MHALEIQYEYLARAREFTRVNGLDAVGERVLEMWERTLDGIETGNLDKIAREIDWVTKYQLIQRYRAAHDLPLSAARIAQLDLAYHDIRRGRGLYYLLQRDGAVERVTRDLDIFTAKEVPPQTTRAKLRGDFIRRAQEKGRDFSADWVHLKLNDQAQRTVLCKDPFRSADERVDQHIWEGVSSATTRSRPIINTRDEPHADAERFRRLHVIVGDSNMSETTTLLKVGATDLVLRMIEAGTVMRDLSLENPIRAIRDVSHDMTGQRRVRLANGKEACALDIQREYLSKARDFNWVTKFQLIERYRAKHDLPLSSARVAQLDLAYHDVHRGRGLYYLLQRRGAVVRAARDIDIFEAKSVPPQTTRARLRGEFIRRAQERRRDFTVDWVHLKLNDQAQRTVLCKDPFRSTDERVEKLIAGM